nr:C40 family peptidase [Texcoconibacillus texcoconensis]
MVSALLLTTFPEEGFSASHEVEDISVIIDEAKTHIGTPYSFGGTSPSGFDCSGFLYYTFQQEGITIPRTTSTQYNYGETVNRDSLEIGDIVFFETYKPGPSHSGIYVGGNEFIHASSSNGITINNLNESYYNQRYIGAKRFVEEVEVEVEEEEEPEVLADLPTGEYHDIDEDHWAQEKIYELSQEGIIQGTSDSFFLPDENISRDQAATIFDKALELDDVDVDELSYSDLDEDYWAFDQIATVTEASILEVSEENFQPLELLTREETAMAIDNAFDLPEVESEVTFTDLNEDADSYDAIQRAAEAGIISGYVDQTFKPEEDVTRAEFVSLIYEAWNLDTSNE